MTEQPVVVTTTIFQMIPWCGLYGMVTIYLSFLFLVVSPILFGVMKSKRDLILWVMRQSIIWNLISALFVFVSGMFKAGMTMGGHFYNDHNVGMLISNAVELLPGCTCLILIAMAVFVLRFILILGTKLKDK